MFLESKVNAGENQKAEVDLASRVFEMRAFQLGWAIFLLLFVIFVAEPMRHVLLVFWVYGKDAYSQGIRVIPRKPLRFTTGVAVPPLLDMITGFGMFFAATLGLSAVLIFGLRIYERVSKKRQTSANC